MKSSKKMRSRYDFKFSFRVTSLTELCLNKFSNQIMDEIRSRESETIYDPTVFLSLNDDDYKIFVGFSVNAKSLKSATSIARYFIKLVWKKANKSELITTKKEMPLSIHYYRTFKRERF